MEKVSMITEQGLGIFGVDTAKEVDEEQAKKLNEDDEKEE